MVKSKPAESRADAVTAGIRSDILAGRLEPGRRLAFSELCGAYSVSVGVLREALVRLVDRGIVRAESNVGFRVMSLSEEDLAGLTSVRAHIEPSFVREAVEVGSRRWEADVVASHHLLESTPVLEAGGLNEDLVRAHADFHLALVSGCGNQRMMDIVSRLRDEADLYLRWYLDAGQIDQRRDRIAGEDRELLAAVLARDADRAENLMREHIRHTADTDIAAAAGLSPAISSASTRLIFE